MSVVVLLAAACTSAQTPPPTSSAFEVLGTLPHDTGAFTQGLEIFDGTLYEGTGLEGQSSMRSLDPTTGQVKQQVDLPDPLFGEGITVVGDRIWQLTYRDGIAIQRDRTSLAEVKRVTYQGEGWGLCLDDDRLVMSDGSAQLTFRDPTTFAETGRTQVTRDGQPVTKINELECVDGDAAWANVWQTDEVVRIDLKTGQVTKAVDLSSLRPPDVERTNVLNGIAAVPGTDEFLVTGKNWPLIFRIRFTG